MADWDDEDFEPTAIASQPTVTDKWEGEDSDDEVKDNWDDDEDEKKQPENGESGPKAVQVKKKKSLKEILAEKEAQKKKTNEERKKQELESKRKLTPEEMLEEKLRRQKLQEESDLQIAKDAFGVTEKSDKSGIDAMDPTSIEEFDAFETALKNKIIKYENSVCYVGFVDSLIRDITAGMDADDLKKITSSLNAIVNEKQKLLKAQKGKKKGKPLVKVDKAADYYGDDLGNEFDFI
ncbi:eukaryotic translation initiation factor 3 subunit J-A-like [Tubulanus polymorphus]|uniref:eukaryotic translation initiation factor 3 subunit J-A-like n=1 Tax=Tubulanus polymorphus TaxID=672921 RepID=UPI003DA24DF5